MSDGRPQSALTLSTVSTGVGLISGVLGIIQFLQQSGKSFAASLWDSLYYIGFIPFGMLAAWVVFGFGLYWLLTKTRVVGEGSDPGSEKAAHWTIFVLILGVGTWIGISMADSNLGLINEPATLLSNEQVLPVAWMRAFGIATLLVAILKNPAARWAEAEEARGRPVPDPQPSLPLDDPGQTEAEQS